MTRLIATGSTGLTEKRAVAASAGAADAGCVVLLGGDGKLNPSVVPAGGSGTGSGTGGVPWTVADTSTTASPSNAYLIDASAGNRTVTLSTPAVGDEVIVHCYSAGQNTVSVAPGTGHSIRGKAGTVTDADTLVIEDGQTVRLVARTTAQWEIV
jgi:hypothetical protein